jgi:hypothetical protein
MLLDIRWLAFLLGRRHPVAKRGAQRALVASH